MSPHPMSAVWMPSVLLGGLLLSAAVLAGRAVAGVRSDRVAALLGAGPGGGIVKESAPPQTIGHQLFARVRRLPFRWAGLAVGLGFAGLRLAGPGGLVVGAGIGCGLPAFLAARSRRQERELAERQLAEVAEATAMAVRSGLSIRQAIEFAADEVAMPMRDSLKEVLRSNELGATLDRALNMWADDVGGDEAMLLVLVLSIHAKSGGDLAGALDEVSETLRHRLSVRRELRALSAQGRISGAILGSLPIAFFIVLSASSRSELAPVYRSPAGIAMVGTGLVLQVLAYFWIRGLLRVEV